MTKQFKIGEYAIGGIIKVDKSPKIVRIQALDWNSKEVVKSLTFASFQEAEMDEFLNDLTSCYYADKILDYILN
jgi:hypothetical protein